jgi:carbon starvation protein CstA
LPNDCNIFLSYLASFETVVLLLVLIGLVASVNVKSILRNPYAIFSILFGLSTLFLIGLIVNNSGAIVRYRSIAIPFILIGLCLKGKESKELTLNSH